MDRIKVSQFLRELNLGPQFTNNMPNSHEPIQIEHSTRFPGYINIEITKFYLQSVLAEPNCFEYHGHFLHSI